MSIFFAKPSFINPVERIAHSAARTISDDGTTVSEELLHLHLQKIIKITFILFEFYNLDAEINAA